MLRFGVVTPGHRTDGETIPDVRLDEPTSGAPLGDSVSGNPARANDSSERGQDYHEEVSEVEQLRAEISELRRLLDKHQWSGLTPAGSIGCCPECAGAVPPLGSGHRPNCAIAAALALPLI